MADPTIVPGRPRLRWTVALGIGTGLLAVTAPELLGAVVLAAILGAGRGQLVLAVGLANIPATARLTATLGAALHQRDFVTTARLTGVPGWAMIGRPLLPNMAEPLLIQ